MFQKAQRKQAKLRLGLAGASGSGKTYSALKIAKGIGGKIAVIDTERGSASLYSDVVEFDVANLQPPFTPQCYISAIHAAEQMGYGVVIIDSLTHAWQGEGGMLDMQDKAAKATRNSYTAWREITPLHNKLVDAILQSPCHVITCLRSKTEYVLQDNDKGKKAPVKMGMAPIFRDGIEYEFTTMFDLSVDGHIATASKDRTGLFMDSHFVPSEETGKQFMDWFSGGVKSPDYIAGLRICKNVEELETYSKSISVDVNNLPENEKNSVFAVYSEILNSFAGPVNLN